MLAYKNSGETFDLTAEYQQELKRLTELQNMLAKAEGKLAGLKRTFRQDSPEVLSEEAEIAALQEQISTLQAPLAGYPEKEAQLSAIQLAERLADERYELFRKRYEEDRVKESAVVTEIRIISPAMPGLYPLKPVKYVYAGLSFLTALIVAVGWALLAEQMSPRIRTVHDLDAVQEVPVLGAIPSMKPSMWKPGEQPS